MRTLASLSLAALAAGCQVTNETVLVATLLQSPAPPAGLGGLQGTAAQVVLGHTSVRNPSAGDVTPISGATVQLYEDGLLVPAATFTESQPGYYQATGSFYQAGHTFRLVATVGADEYWGEVPNVPSEPTMTLPGGTFNPGTGLYTYASYATDVPDPYDIGRGTCSITTTICDIGFYGVWTVSGATFDATATPNCTNAPQNGAEWLALAFFDDTAWRVNPFAPAKATCFPPPGGPDSYVVGLSDLKKGTVSGNLSIASMALAGTSAAAGVIVAAP